MEFKTTPHNDCVWIAPSDFSSVCMQANRTQSRQAVIARCCLKWLNKSAIKKSENRTR